MAIKVSFSQGQTEAKSNALHQWDYGQMLEIESADLPTIVEVHFACQSMNEAIIHSCTAVDGVATVAIPNRCLEQSNSITAWVYAIFGSTGTTIKTITIPVISRTRPSRSNEIPQDISDRYTELITEVEEAVNKIADGQVMVASAAKATSADRAAWAENASTAAHAESATQATNASTASYAKSAGSAETATKATNATNAVKAQSADYASVAAKANTADNATTAEKATNATNAVKAQNADYATIAANAENAGKAANADHAIQAANADFATKAAYDNVGGLIHAKYASFVGDFTQYTDGSILQDGTYQLKVYLLDGWHYTIMQIAFYEVTVADLGWIYDTGTMIAYRVYSSLESTNLVVLNSVGSTENTIIYYRKIN